MIRSISVTVGAVVALGLFGGACAPKGASEFNDAQKALKAKQWAKAAAGFERAIASNPDFAEAHYNLGAAQYQLAAQRLRALVKAKGSAALQQIVASKAPTKAALAQGLATLPEADTQPLLKLLNQSFASRAKASMLFKAGKWVVVKRQKVRRRILAQLAQVTKLEATLEGAPRGQQLASLIQPALFLAASPAKKP